MRILKLRFKNLNSLVGEWAIDLTHPAFLSDGIFAITGPTGAGKTTILDAICLALYGRTPRLDKVTKSGNEIMSRQTGDCFAEVTFETNTGRYRSHWSQHRAKKKPEGDLQAPKHEISDAFSGKILEAKIKGVANQIEEVTGMDFDRFTRSMLLAQGGFAAFLQADPDERAPILEQITGTDIYSKISVCVHERSSKEQKALDNLQAELAGMRFLTPEEKERTTISLNEKIELEVALNKELAQKNQAIAWIENIVRLEESLAQLGRQKEDLQARLDAFAPEQQRLRLATQALELAGEYAALIAIRREQHSARLSLIECQDALPSCEEAFNLAECAMKIATEQLDNKKNEQQTAQPVIRRVRELDWKISERNAPISASNKNIVELAKSLAVLRTKQDGDTTELEGKRKALGGLLQMSEETRADEYLVEHLTGIRSRFENLQSISHQLLGKRGEIAQAERQCHDSMQVWRDLSLNLANVKVSLDGIQRASDDKQGVLQNIPESRDLAQWRRSQSLLVAQKEGLGRVLDAAHVLSKSKGALAEHGARQATLTTEELTLQVSSASLTERQVALEKEVHLLEAQLTEIKKIEDLEGARHQLQDGESCPLCGAKEHPFAEGNVPVSDETKKRLLRVRGDLKSVEHALSEGKVKLALVNKDLEHVALSHHEHVEKIEQATRLIGEICSELVPELILPASKPGLGASELGERVQNLLRDNARLLAQTTKILETAELAERELAVLRKALDETKDLVAKAERETQTAAHSKESAEHLLIRLRAEEKGHQEQQQTSLDLLQEEVRPLGASSLSLDRLEDTLEELTSRRDEWVARQKVKTELEQKVVALEIQTGHQVEQILKSEDHLKKQQVQLGGLVQERDLLARERQDVFGDKSPDNEELRLATAIELAQKEQDVTRQKTDTANQALSQLQFRIVELEKAIATRGIEMKRSDDAFLARLKELGFSDEENFNAACLRESERKQLVQESQKLATEKAEIASRLDENAKLLETERQKQVTEEPLDGLRKGLGILVNNLRDLQQEIGAISQKLKDDENLKQQQQERVKAIERQKRECSRWDLLHKLIGSADGKKYRNFAQGLTFEMMVGHANRQLRKMTDRYLLVRDDSQPLELNVIDAYQAGEVRSTKNLSGGESFSVSLALALGLSQMASKKVRVDSLFLDEGFGTLDEEALDTALETLTSLQQEGKLIGVISHMPALRERISTQIQVTRHPGGRSRISGPGCGPAAAKA